MQKKKGAGAPAAEGVDVPGAALSRGAESAAAASGRPPAPGRGEQFARRLNRLRVQLEKLKLKFTDAGKLMYLDDLTAVGRAVETASGRLQHVELATDGALPAALTNLERAVRKLGVSNTPVQDLDQVQALATELVRGIGEREPPRGRS